MNGYNFTERVRKMLAGARTEAGRLQHEYVGTEHILLALTQSDGKGHDALVNLGVPLDRVRGFVESTVGVGRGGAAGNDLPYTSRAKKVLELAMGQARDMKHSYVGTEHILLGLIAEEKGIAAQVLQDFGVTLEDSTDEVLRLVSSAGAVAPPPRPSESRSRQGFLSAIPPLARLRPIIESAEKIAAEMERQGPLAEHIAIALLRDGSGMANAALDRLGLDRADVISKLEVVAPRGATPVEAYSMDWLDQLLHRLQLTPGKSAETADLFLAILDVSVPVARVFAERGITAAALRFEIDKMRG